MCNSVLHDFYSTLSIIRNDIASNIRLAIGAKHYDTIESTLLNLVPPNQGHWSGTVVVSNDLDAVLMRLLNLIVKELRLVVLYLDTNTTNLNFILNDIRVNIQRSYDSWATTKPDFVTLNLRITSFTLDKDTCRLALHDDVLRDDHIVFWLHVHHDGTGVEMGEWALMNGCVTFSWQYTSCVRIILSITFEIAVEDFHAGVRHRDNARHFSMCLSCTPI